MYLEEAWNYIKEASMDYISKLCNEDDYDEVGEKKVKKLQQALEIVEANLEHWNW